MRFGNHLLALVLLAAVWGGVAQARINTVIIHNGNDPATPNFKLRAIPAPASDDAATKATFSLLSGRRDGNGGGPDKLHDGKVPTSADAPAENFFFAAGTPGGRLLVDLGRVMPVDQINTYSWHRSSRGPQVYRLYASDGEGQNFQAEPKPGADLEQIGWDRIAQVDTRPVENEGEAGGQYGVSIFDSEGPLGPYRYLLFDVSSTDSNSPFGNTFYSEIDVIPGDRTAPAREKSQPLVVSMRAGSRTYRCTIDTSETPDLTKWAQDGLAPVVKEWYPRIVKLLASQGYQAPRSFNIVFSARRRGVAATSGTTIYCAAEWFRHNRQGEAVGAIVHEMVHVVQQYRMARRNNPNADQPGWLIEGIPDYVRWYLYEPQSHGAEISKANASRARYDGSYRVSANFLNWVSMQYDPKIVTKLNAALREGRYSEDLWSQNTGHTLAQLDDQWKASLAR